MFYAKNDKIVINGNRGRSEIFSYRPDNIELAPLGQLYLLGEVSFKLKSPNTLFLLNAIAATLKKTYYQHPQQGPVQRLESALRMVNYEVPRLVGNNNLEALPKYLHLVVLVVGPTHLYFSKTPGPGIFLLRQGTWLNISATPSENSRSTKLFSQIIQGALCKNDQIFATSPAVISYMHQQTFRSHLVETQLKNAQSQLERLLRTTGSQDTAAILRLTIQKESTPQASFSTLPLHHAATTFPQSPPQPKIDQGIRRKHHVQQALFPAPQSSPNKTLPNNILKLLRNFYRQGLLRLQGIVRQLKNLKHQPKFSWPAPSQRSWYFIISALILALILIAGLISARSNSHPPQQSPWEILSKLPTTKIIKTAAPLIQFSQLGLELNPSWFILAPSNNQPNLIILGPTTLYRLPLEANRAGRFVFLPTSLIPARLALAWDGQIVIIRTENGLSLQAFDPQAEKFQPLELQFNKPIVQARTFQNRIYLLTQDLEIYTKAMQQQAVAPALWNQTDLTQQFSQALDFEVNGSIWLLALDRGGQPMLTQLKQGRVSKMIDLTKAATVAFPKPQQLHLATSPESSNLYLLDPILGRIVVINKETGSVQTQLLNSEFKGAQTLILQAEKNRLFVLTREAILVVPLP